MNRILLQVLNQHCRILTLCLVAHVGVCGVAARFATAQTVVNFDDVNVPGGDGNESTYAGNLYASSGVLFSTGDLDADLFAVGDLISYAKLNDNIDIANSSASSVSRPNIVLPSPPAKVDGSIVTFHDLLMMFTTPVTSVNVTSDSYCCETPDVIRLLALQPTATPNQFQVLAIDVGLDNAVTSPGNLLAVDVGRLPFSNALIQIRTEYEGFDDLTFTKVPEPSTVWLAALVLVAAVARNVACRRLGRLCVVARTSPSTRSAAGACYGCR
jgi:hypothetical protein